ncbi:MAG: D,D-heptose 1,7-bisphosphate phosphatase [Ignavibacteriae bacterium HGW-Ignavibacteriae-2]|jgi:D,D-heptose 1,7-bisphosphate phosphatase|nr:MAG: D,D-heptose 1,7-bisphosphate phosphatase [Ignavibacteriae bacterium HGW-Ignavibacteriae-2]
MLYRAVFFDRDDTLNIDPGYLNDPSEVKLFPGVPEGIANLKAVCDFKIVVVSNQSGITRGLVSNNTVDLIHNRINEILSEFNTSIDAFYYCPYHPDYDPPEKTICRKPSPYMIVQAAEELKLDLKKSYLVGDKYSDIECAINAGVKPILINYNQDKDLINLLKKDGKTPNFVASNFNAVVNFIISDSLGDSN